MEYDSQQKQFLKALRQYEGAIYKICLLYSDRTPEGIADLYQEIVYTLWRNYGKFKGGSSLTTWLYRVALNAARRHSYNHSRDVRFLELDPSLTETLSVEPPDEQVRRLYELIDRLPPADKVVATLYLEELSVNEMAVAMNCSPRTVSRRISEMKSKLKEMNDRDESEPPVFR